MRLLFLLLLWTLTATAQAEKPCVEPGDGCFCLTGQPGPGALPTSNGFCFPAFEGRVESIDAGRLQAMTPHVWQEGCPVSPAELRVVKVAHWTLEGDAARGEIVVAAQVADTVLQVFERLWNERFPIAKLRPMEAYQGDDDRSMADNNSSAFNCRRVAGTKHFSRHSWGEAIDLNPLQNPWVRGELVSPPTRRQYVARTPVEPGMIVDKGPAVRAFQAVGWRWGGRWKRAKDWQHFSPDGR